MVAFMRVSNPAFYRIPPGISHTLIISKNHPLEKLEGIQEIAIRIPDHCRHA